MSKLKSYLFDLGNSTDGPIGYCTRIEAESAAKAVEQLKEIIADLNREYDLAKGAGLRGDPSRRVEYFVVYFNAQMVSEANIVEVNPVEERAAT
jgi:hypothetical protein